MRRVGNDAPEILQGFVVCMKHGLSKKQFDETVGIHPTIAEEFVSMHTKTKTVEGKGTRSPLCASCSAVRNQADS